jgi:hypothetical protein
MSTRTEAGGTVFLREVGNGPHRVADQRGVGLGQRDQLVIGVDGLSLFVRPDGDRRQRRDQQTGVKDPLDDREDIRVERNSLIERTVHEEVVDAGGFSAFEEIVRRHDAEIVFESEEIIGDGVDQVEVNGILDDGPTLVPDFLGVGPKVLSSSERWSGAT